MFLIPLTYNAGMFSNFSLQSFASGVALGIVLSVAWLTGGPETYLRQDPPSSVQAGNEVPPESGAITVVLQKAGASVTIESLTVPPPGVWVAVRDVAGKELRNVLGAVKVGGPKTHFSIPLLRETVPGKLYAVELYRDDSSGTFNPNLSAYVDFDTGKRVTAYFKTLP